MNKKHIYFLILGVGLCTGIIAGCGTSGKPYVNPTASPTADPTQEPTADPTEDPTQVSSDINLSEYNEDVTIDTAGTYNITGTLKGHALIVDTTTGTTTLNLKGITIANDSSAAIIGASGDGLIINLEDGTTNNISDGGSDEDHDGAIYGDVPLTFTGTGTLNVTGNYQEGICTTDQNITFENGVYNVSSADDGINAGGDNGGTLAFNGGEFHIQASGDGIDSNGSAEFNGADVYVIGSSAGGNAGIDCDNGYTINAGQIIAFGTDMLETPQTSSKQYTMCFNLSTSYASGSTVVLKDSDGNEIISAEADDSFKTLILSDESLTKGTYKLYINNSAVSLDGSSDFEITQTVNTYGSNSGGGDNPPQPPNAK